MRLHLIALPHTRVARDFATCAYSQKALKFTKMMSALGYEVVLYASEGSDGSFCELIQCQSEVERTALFGWADPNGLPFWPTDEQFSLFNSRALAALRDRVPPGEMSEREPREDLVLMSSGWSQRALRDALPDLTFVEPFVGYEGILTPYCAFESHAWRHYIYGMRDGMAKQQGVRPPGTGDGRWFDEVIPNFFDVGDFRLGAGDGGYLLFVGRLIGRKGPAVALELAEAAGMKLVLAGPGATEHGDGFVAAPEFRLEGNLEYVGPVGIEDRTDLMCGAAALIAPTTYVEPFGGVTVEANLCGTPAITTPWGAFSETVEPDVTGYRFRSFREGLEAIEKATLLDRGNVRERAVERFSLEAVGREFDSWLRRIETLFGEGWYDGRPVGQPPPNPELAEVA